MTFYTEKRRCVNCGRTKTAVSWHHIIPRMVGGCDEHENRMLLCTACERFLHTRFTHEELAYAKQGILKNEGVMAFGKFVNTPHYIGHSAMDENVKDFEAWRLALGR